ncbi:MAG: MFS transporter [Solirubrobacterales bacterium]
MSAGGAAFRLSVYYAALFAAVGVHLPFWPVWLAAKGLTPAEMGWLAAATYLAKVTVNPVVGHVVDRRGDRRLPMLALAGGATLCFLLFAVTDGFWPILGVTMLALGLWGGVMPIGDSLAMMAVARFRLDYGRIRLWGSLSFIVAATLVGRLLVDAPPSVLMGLVAGGLGVMALACVGLPDLRIDSRKGTPPAPLRPLLSSRPYLLFVAAAALNQAAHTVYYAFATLHWKAAGVADDTIGLLWSEGVLAEIVLFAFSGAAVRRLGPGGLLVTAGLGGVLRWLVLGSSTALPLLVGAQLLHAATFGCAHLGAMHFLQRAIPTGLSARAQTLYATVATGIVPGLMSPFTGWLFQGLGGSAFLVMAGFSLAATGLAWAVMRRWDGAKIL